MTELQRTLSNPVSCVGTTLHTGEKVYMTLLPAPEDTGIMFCRTDVSAKSPNIIADYRNVTGTTLNTTIENQDNVKVSTIEHLMAALWGCKIDNAVVEVDGPEVPIMDGSSEPFVFLIECAGIKRQSKPRKYIEVLKEIKVDDGNKRASIKPASGFEVNFTIDFDNAIISKQEWQYKASDVSFKTDVARARTFGFEHEVETLRAQGLAKGGSLDNAIVVSGNKILNKEGLRYHNEFVRHKILDCIGDLYLMGGHLIGHVEAIRSGHALNNKILHKLFSDPTAWRFTETAITDHELAIA